MPFSQLGFTEILLILFIVLLVFGAKRLPEMGSALGKGIREFKKSIKDVQDAVESGDNNSLHNAPPHPPSRRPGGERRGAEEAVSVGGWRLAVGGSTKKGSAQSEPAPSVCTVPADR